MSKIPTFPNICVYIWWDVNRIGIKYNKFDRIIGLNYWMVFLSPKSDVAVVHSSQGRFLFLFFAFWPKMVIFAPKKLFLDQIFWKMMIFGQILSNWIYSSFHFRAAAAGNARDSPWTWGGGGSTSPYESHKETIEHEFASAALLDH